MGAQNDTEIEYPERTSPEYKKRGMNGFYRYVKKNLIYPEDAKKEGVEGRVFVKFIISESGQVEESPIEVVRGVFPSLDEEAIRLIKESGRWKSGTQDGKPVRMVMVLPIIFRLKD